MFVLVIVLVLVGVIVLVAVAVLVTVLVRVLVLLAVLVMVGVPTGTLLATHACNPFVSLFVPSGHVVLLQNEPSKDEFVRSAPVRLAPVKLLA